jgi:hypothetical protein
MYEKIMALREQQNSKPQAMPEMDHENHG